MQFQDGRPIPFVQLRDVGVRTVETREDRLRIERVLLAAEPGLRFSRRFDGWYEAPKPIEWISTTVGLEGECVASIFPPAWEPQWARTPGDSTKWYCLNRPRFQLVIPPFCPPRLDECARPAAGDDSIGYMDRYEVIEETQWYGVYEAGDLEVRRWVQRMIRIIKKGMTNRYCFVSHLTGRPVRRSDKGESTWFGPDAIAWARGASNRFLGGLLRPEDEYETFYWPLPTGGVLCNWSVTKRHAEDEARWARLLAGDRGGE